ncbi:tRNA (adenosine(37)-N6)-threonylcarbamoyltransferase complex ATPase subunit type 1 TsaE [Magnetospirillum sp. 64-120]|uniref:tRNA (adenosine(37)-N6)-threonylcarbamoyltransferase complex ATPase subunit type 1 TsaE n=1 Tax=Magnetospirillum sp. 64-120 TaxID=1895778 RepID=UPI00092C508B|nr:tRNA (adenosine(37)-N6)-threonylcarbamoyltransferase complex ATPase subunit type 1 TsaE [Magnetospirillum sp. 64-120]OJX68512.1 MAG: tRNA (adenosine(37)-N6)-threonylcarbamoyltransferase complex ATPase subunit type 1 TsaE [Magnetospirillum sp. 64-120]
MPTHIVHLADEAATTALGHQLAALARPGDVIALHGTLGMGKSTLARAFIRALTDLAEEVPSPTFTLVQMYEGKSGDLWHFDLYRLDKPEDAFELGIEDAFADGISLIEWPDRLGRLMPRERLEIHLHPGHKTTSRTAELISHGQWDDRLKDMNI